MAEIAQNCPIGHRQKSCPGLHSATTGPITTIQTPLESSWAVGVHWLCHLPDFRFQNGRNCPKLPDRPPPKILSGLTLGNYWPDYPDSNTTWMLSGCRCALAMSFVWFPISKWPKMPKIGQMWHFLGVLTASSSLPHRLLATPSPFNFLTAPLRHCMLTAPIGHPSGLHFVSDRWASDTV